MLNTNLKIVKYSNGILAIWISATHFSASACGGEVNQQKKSICVEFNFGEFWNVIFAAYKREMIFRHLDSLDSLAVRILLIQFSNCVPYLFFSVFFFFVGPTIWQFAWPCLLVKSYNRLTMWLGELFFVFFTVICQCFLNSEWKISQLLQSILAFLC